MRVLSKKEWIAVTLAIAVVIVFIGARFFTLFANQSGIVAPVDNTSASAYNADEQSNNFNNSTNTTQNTNNMNSDQSALAGLAIKDVVVGTGAEAKPGDIVDVQYTGKFADGKVFDSSIPRGQPFEFQLGVGGVIKGWDLGILGMKVGGKRTLTIPPALGYGADGYPPVIPPNSTLYFDVELVGVKMQ